MPHSSIPVGKKNKKQKQKINFRQTKTDEIIKIKQQKFKK